MAVMARVPLPAKLAAVAASLLGLLTVMVAAGTPITALDAAARQALPPIWGGPTQGLWLWITEVGTASTVIPVLGVSALLLIRAGQGRVALAQWGAYLGAEVIVQPLKILVDRPRPPLSHLQILFAHAGSPSFPSGHATAAMAVYGFLAVLMLRSSLPRGVAWAFAVMLGMLVAAIVLSRHMLGVHYASDLAGGLLCGFIPLALASMAIRPSSPGARRN